RVTDEPLLAGVTDADCFYFVHSYRAPDGPWVRGWCEHGGLVPAVVAHGRIWGVQFHPEKSQDAGARLLARFLQL
ncbi:glutamine amidotransferase-related protein, partial [Enterococcus faecium]